VAVHLVDSELDNLKFVRIAFQQDFGLFHGIAP
jgi:hypothetical protein